MGLEEIRAKIDEIDGEILELLERRVLLAKETRQFKEKVIDAEREKEILAKLKSEIISDEDTKKIFSEIILVCRNAQKE